MATDAAAPAPRRKRDATASRARLLAAAAELFDAHGYDGTTSREIGERAGVDPAMIARYYGGKAQLYVAVLQAESARPVDILDRDRLVDICSRALRRGPGPVLRVAIADIGDPTARAAASDELQRRIVDPLRDRLAGGDQADADLRAEIITAAVTGVLAAHRQQQLTRLATASADDIIAIVAAMIGAR